MQLGFVWCGGLTPDLVVGWLRVGSRTDIGCVLAIVAYLIIICALSGRCLSVIPSLSLGYLIVICRLSELSVDYLLICFVSVLSMISSLSVFYGLSVDYLLVICFL